MNCPGLHRTGSVRSRPRPADVDVETGPQVARPPPRFDRGRGRAFFVVAAHLQVFAVGAATREPMSQTRISFAVAAGPGLQLRSRKEQGPRITNNNCPPCPQRASSSRDARVEFPARFFNRSCSHRRIKAVQGRMIFPDADLSTRAPVISKPRRHARRAFGDAADQLEMSCNPQPQAVQLKPESRITWAACAVRMLAAYKHEDVFPDRSPPHRCKTTHCLFPSSSSAQQFL